MARIRSIHPGLFTDEGFMALTMEAPLACVLLTGLWCECDDDGVFDWKELTLKARYLPVANADIGALLKVLQDKRFIRAFQNGGKPFGAIRNFRKYQRPKKPTSRGLLPDDLREYVGLEVESTEPVPHQFPSGTEKSPQKEEGGRREGSSTPPTPPKRGGVRVSKAELPYTPEFEEFWRVYPRRKRKRAALDAYLKAQKRAPPEQILAGAMRHAAECEGKEDRFIPHPATWLNDDGWKDEPDERNRTASKPEKSAARAASDAAMARVFGGCEPGDNGALPAAAGCARTGSGAHERTFRVVGGSGPESNGRGAQAPFQPLPDASDGRGRT